MVVRRVLGVPGGSGWSGKVAGDVRNQFQVVARHKSGGINGDEIGSKPRLSELDRRRLWLVSGDDESGDATVGFQASDRYQARLVRWPELGETVGSIRGSGSG